VQIFLHVCEEHNLFLEWLFFPIFTNFKRVEQSAWTCHKIKISSKVVIITEARVRSQTVPCGICSGRSGTGTGFFAEYFSFSIIIPSKLCNLRRWQHH